MIIDVLYSQSFTVAALLIVTSLLYLSLDEFIKSSDLRRVPGPLSFSLSRLRMIYEDWRGERVRTLKKLHDLYGPVVRVSSHEVSFNSLSALRTIYGAGNDFERTSFYRPFDVYGRQNLFTYGPAKEHRERKKILSHAYANNTILSAEVSPMIEKKARQYLEIIAKSQGNPVEIFSSLHYFSIDSISEFVYGPDFGGTKALTGSAIDRGLLVDILNPARRKLAWFAVHLPKYTKWVLTRQGLTEWLVNFVGLIPMKKPTTYSGIRAHALKACSDFMEASSEIKESLHTTTVIGRLHKYQQGHPNEITELDIASECADHLLAGIDTTADSLLFLFWALSLPKNAHFQLRLQNELKGVSSLNSNAGFPALKELVRLPYLNAVIKETLRLYAPLPATEPRSSPMDTVIDGYRIPAGTVVGMSPYCLHRVETVYPDPLVFNPERWLDEKGSAGSEAEAAVNRWFWAFSSGSRMCIGIHLANAEMLALVAAVYGTYKTALREGDEDISPAVTSRYELFYDETMGKLVEHECWLKFEKA